MASTLTWLDTSREEQRRMRELLNLFAETESRDELGIGQIRDAFGDLLFPGTSTLHTRARYLLIVPWCYREAVLRNLSDAAASARVDANERRLIKTLKDAGETDGLIGRIAGVAVKNLPSTIYWGALGQYRIRMSDDQGSLFAHAAVTESDELTERATGGWAPTLPPVPRGFPNELEGGLDLTPSEAAWLRDRVRLGAPDSLLVHLLEDENRPDGSSFAPWVDPAVGGLSPVLADQLAHAALFSLAVHGAPLLYNLLVAERYEAAGFTTVDEPVETYRELLVGWAKEVAGERRWSKWDREAMWSSVIGQNPRIAGNIRLRAFVDLWLDAVVSGAAANAQANQLLRDLVSDRERTIKRAQSRLINERLLRTWSGAAGTGQLTYRWRQVRRMVLDIHNGLAADDVAA